MRRITYTKNFLSGTLAGLSVRCGFNADAKLAHGDMLRLQAHTPQNPGSDLITGAKFWVSNVGSEELQ